MGGAARALALGLVIGSNGAFAVDPRLRTEKGVLPQGEQECGLRVTVMGEGAACGSGDGGAACDERTFSLQADRVQAFVGGETREAGIAHNSGSRAWKEVLDFGCMDGRDAMVLTVYDKLVRSLATCEVGLARELSDGEKRVCGGAHGAHFWYSVELDSVTPPEMETPRASERSRRGLQTGTETPAPSPSSPADDDVAAPTFPPTVAEPVPLPTPEPTPEVVETPEPTAAATVAATATPEPTTAPVAPPTPEPVAATPEPTSAPIAPLTPRPVTPEPTTAPVAATARPVTPEPTTAPVGTPPTSRPVAVAEPTPPPTAEPTTKPTTAPAAPEPTGSPVPIGTDEPTQSPVPAPIATADPPTETPTEPVTPEPTAAPVATSKPSALPSSPPTVTPVTTTTKPVAPPTTPPTREMTSGPVDAGTEAPVAPPTPSTAAPISPVVTVAPVVAPVPTIAPVVATVPTAAPEVIATTPSPTEATDGSFGPDATLSPASEEVCTAACVDYVGESEWLGRYFDYRCAGSDELIGCNLDPTNSEALDCRLCFTNRVKYEDENGEIVDDYPECPCCVAEEPQTEECIAEADAAGTPAPTPIASTDERLDLRTSANDPDLMMISFNDADCSASGIAIIDGGSTVFEVSGYESEDGGCSENFDIITGTTVCESDDTVYEWEFAGDSYYYEYTCAAVSGNSASRRRLVDATTSYTSVTVLCNDGDRFFSLANLDGEEEGLVYIKTAAEEFGDYNPVQAALSGGEYCDDDVTVLTTTVLTEGVDNVLEEPDDPATEGDDFPYIVVIPAATALVLLMICGCFCCYRQRKGKEGRADQMRRNLGYTPDMEAKGDGNFGPTNQHVAITRGGGPQVTPAMLATKSYQPTYPMHQRAPSEAPSSVIEDNIANNYRPKTAAKNWEKRKVHKELTKPASQQHVIGAGPTSEELKTENMPASQSARSEQLSERSLTQLELSNKSAAHPSAAQAQYGYAFEDVDVDGDDDDDARSAATGMSGPSKYAPSGYAPSSHHDGVTHDLMSQYEPSVYEADSQYDPSLYGRESEYGDESSSYSFNQESRSNQRGGYGGHHGGRGRGHHNSISGRASVADTAAMSHLGSVLENDDLGGDSNSAYAPSESYVSSYISSEDDDGRPARSIHPRGVEGGRSPTGGYSRHDAHRSGREIISGGRSGFGASSVGGSSSRHSGGRSGFEGDSRDYEDEEDGDDMRNVPVSMEDLEYYSEDNPSSRGAPLTDVDERHNGRRW